MTDRELMLMALEELEEHADVGYGNKDLLQALRDRLAQHELSRVNLNDYVDFVLDLQDDRGWFIGEMDLVRWLVKNKQEDYFNSEFYKEKCERTKDIGVINE
jgi:predicted LPLAT superfamily acyltransferase